MNDWLKNDLLLRPPCSQDLHTASVSTWQRSVQKQPVAPLSARIQAQAPQAGLCEPRLQESHRTYPRALPSGPTRLTGITASSEGFPCLSSVRTTALHAATLTVSILRGRKQAWSGAVSCQAHGGRAGARPTVCTTVSPHLSKPPVLLSCVLWAFVLAAPT